MITLPDGTRWATVAEAAQRVHVREATIRVWVTRRKVKVHHIEKKPYVSLDDVEDAEHEWRQRAQKAG